MRGQLSPVPAGTLGPAEADLDLTVFVDVDESNLTQRLRGCWQSYGLAAEDIAQKVEEIDLPNGRAIIAGSSEP